MPSGNLIPCKNCGQALSAYRAVCPFCGTPTGRTEGTPPPAPVKPTAPARDWDWLSAPGLVRTTTPATRKPMSKRRRIIVGVVLFWLLCAGCAALLDSGSDDTGSNDTGQNDMSLSPQAKAYLDSAMPALSNVLSEYQSGDAQRAADDWGAIGDMPQNTTADGVVGEHYLTYANNVRYYMMQDGSCTLKELEDSRQDAELTIAAALSM